MYINYIVQKGIYLYTDSDTFKAICILFPALHILRSKGWCKYMNLDEVICFCQNVTSGMIKDAVDSGAATLEEVQEKTGAGTVCGSCIDNVRRLVEQFAAERASR